MFPLFYSNDEAVPSVTRHLTLTMRPGTLAVVIKPEKDFETARKSRLKQLYGRSYSNLVKKIKKQRRANSKNNTFPYRIQTTESTRPGLQRLKTRTT